MDLIKNEKDFRPESFRPVSHDSELRILEKVVADGDAWHERRKMVLKNVYHNLTDLIADAKDRTKETSLAVFKPTKVLDFIWKLEKREWSPKKLAILKQHSLFDVAGSEKSEVVKKLPYKFSYVFEDNKGRKSTIMIEDWEVGALYWRMFEKYEDETKACEAVKKKYLDDFVKTKDLHFFLGTSAQYHLIAQNPFMIIGTFHPKKVTQTTLDL